MEKSNYYTKQLLNDELMHYGVMGMHWGVRRYQPYPAAYDGDGKFIGKKALKRQVKKDKYAIDEQTKKTSILGSALTSATKRHKRYEEKLNKQLAKEPETYRYSKEGGPADVTNMSKKARKLFTKSMAAEMSKETIKAKYEEGAAILEDMVKKYKDKYGKENVRDVIYDTDKYGNRVVSEKVNSWREWANAQTGPATVAGMITVGSLLAGNPVVAVGFGIPGSRKMKGNAVEQSTYATAKNLVKKGMDLEYKDQMQKKNQHLNQNTNQSVNNKVNWHTDNEDVRSAKLLQTNKTKINNNAPRYYVDQEYEMLSKIPQLRGKSRAEMAKMFKVSNIDSNGTVSLEPQGDIKNLFMFPYVEAGIDKKSGKLRFNGAATDT